MISEALVRLVQTVDLSCTDINTISKKDRNEILHDPRHLEVPSGASKTVSEAMVPLVQIVYLSCTEAKTISKWTKTSFHLSPVT
jgi:hypothetical protein